MGNFLFTDRAWEDYLYWQTQDKKTLKRINQLLQDIDRNGHEGIGKPEVLRNELSGWWSRPGDGRLSRRPLLARGTAGQSYIRIATSP